VTHKILVFNFDKSLTLSITKNFAMSS